MKKYLVFTTDLALAPLQGENPRGGCITDFDHLDEARGFAEGEKENWDRVFIFLRHEKGEIERLEHFQRPLDEKPGTAQRYVGNKRIRDK